MPTTTPDDAPDPTSGRPLDRRVDRRLERWLDAGIITTEQAEAIRAFEDGGSGRRTPIAAEALGYLGASLAVIAAIVAAEEWWAELERWARVTVVLVASLTSAAGGWWIRSSDEPAVQRLTSFLWFVSSAGVATATGIAVELDGPEDVALAALLTALWSAALWWQRRRPLQAIATFLPLVTALSAALAIDHRIELPFIGIAVWGFGLAWIVLATDEWIGPRAVCQALGALAMLGGAQCAVFGDVRDAALVLGLLTAGGLLLASVAAGSTVLLGVGAAGTFLFVPEAIVTWFADTLGVPLALLLVGLALLGASLVTARLKREVTDA